MTFSIYFIISSLKSVDRVAQLVERRSSNSKVAGSRPSRGRQHLSACAGYGNYIIHTLEHFHPGGVRIGIAKHEGRNKNIIICIPTTVE